VRVLTYIFIGAGAAVAVIALAVTLLDNGEQATIEPQSEVTSAVTAKPQSTAQTPAQSTAQSTAKSTVQSGAADGKQSGATVAQQPATGSARAPASEAVDATQSGPAPTVSIDLAQVRPDGNAVFAGKAAPHAEVTVFEGEVVLGRTKADENGEWVIIPEAALGPGEHLVSVGAVSEDGTSSVADITMAIQVGETTEERPLVALLPQAGSDIPELLQSPDDRPATTVDRASDADQPQTAEDKPMIPAVAPRSLSWKAGGELVVAGASRGGVRVEAVADGIPFGSGAVMADGSWQVGGKVDMTKPGRTMMFTLRDSADSAVATYELPVKTRDLSQGLDGSRMVIVQRGDALWRIAYSSYGEGIRYVDIVRRNAAAINDPDLIFPNQIFALPQDP
jgi:nucleoid-associated protein YgaU